MQQITQILLKEIKDYFISPIAYIVISIVLAFVGWLFFADFFIYSQANMRSFFNLLPFAFSFLAPAVTMRLFSEEINLGSYEILVTLPVRYRDIIIGKFLAAVSFIIAFLIPTLVYPICISFMGDLDWGPVIGGYAGCILLGAAFCAIGLFMSAMTRNQIIALIISFVACFLITVIDKMLFFIPESFVAVIGYMGAGYHFQNIAKGVVDSRDIIYFLSVIFIGLYLTHLTLEEKI